MDIEKLKPEVVDQIAAGEVVERPAHLVKELIENSIDAGARFIELQVDEGGKYVSISDDGQGIFKEDLSLACARHATSKIKKSDDLWNLSTFGFRGEALASISSVSELTILSKRKGADQAYKYVHSFGKPSEPLRTGSMEGTTIEIKDLFKNVPARLKFLKSDSAEVTQIKNVVKAMAMAYPEVGFKLKNKGKSLMYYPASETARARVQQVLGCEEIFEVQHSYEGYDVNIYFSSPNETFGTRKQIWSFVQNRWVEDKTVIAAIMEAYRSLLMHGEYPYCVVKITAPKDDVDVNIHPTKSQVKFRDNKTVFRLVHYGLRNELEKAPWLEALMGADGSSQLNNPGLSELKPARIYDTPQNLSFKEDSLATTQFSKKEFRVRESEEFEKPSLKELKRAAAVEVNAAFVGSSAPTSFDPSTKAQNVNNSTHSNHFSGGGAENASSDFVKRPQAESFWSSLQVLGQSHLTYILAESGDSLYLIDQHAAHERVVFEQLMERWQNRKFQVQNFLIPLTIDLTEEQTEALIQLKESFLDMGIGLDQAGPSTLLITGAPSIIKEVALVKAVHRFAEELTEKGGSFSLENTIADVFATMACHSVVRAGQALSVEEMKNLLRQMDEFSLSSYCPHGRNVYVRHSLNQIELDFGRKV